MINVQYSLIDASKKYERFYSFIQNRAKAFDMRNGLRDAIHTHFVTLIGKDDCGWVGKASGR